MSLDIFNTLNRNSDFILQFDSSFKILEKFNLDTSITAFKIFLEKLDQFLLTREIEKFLAENNIMISTKMRNSRDIKKFMNRIYKSVDTRTCLSVEQHVFYQFTPNFLEMANWETLLYLSKIRYKQSKCSMSDDAWFELSCMLVRASPIIMTRFLKTLKTYSLDDTCYWLEKYKQFDRRPIATVPNPCCPEDLYPDLKKFPNQPTRHYIGDIKLKILFVYKEDQFELMLNYLKVRLCCFH